MGQTESERAASTLGSSAVHGRSLAGLVHSAYTGGEPEPAPADRLDALRCSWESAWIDLGGEG
jgi:hypothetical protein